MAVRQPMKEHKERLCGRLTQLDPMQPPALDVVKAVARVEVHREVERIPRANSTSGATRSLDRHAHANFRRPIRNPRIARVARRAARHPGQKWSLASTVGNAGTTIFELLWRRRY